MPFMPETGSPFTSQFVRKMPAELPSFIDGIMLSLKHGSLPSSMIYGLRD